MRRPAIPLQPRHEYAAGFPRGLLHLAYTGYGVARTLVRTCTAVRPISTRLESVLDLRGFHYWFLHSYTFPSCLTNPDRLAVPVRPAVVGAAPTVPCDSRIGLLPASAGCCDSPPASSFHPRRVRWRLVAHVHDQVDWVAAHRGRLESPLRHDCDVSRHEGRCRPDLLVLTEGEQRLPPV